MIITEFVILFGYLFNKILKTVIRNKAVIGLRDLFEDGEFSDPHSIIVAKEEYKRSSDSAYAFLREETVTGPDYAIPKTELYDGYKWWAQESGLQPVSRTKFNKKLKGTFSVEDWLTRERDLKKKTWHWKGIKLKEGEED